MKPPSLYVIAIASSAGGLAALSQLLGSLESGLSAAVLVVQHLDPRHKSMLADILRRRTSLVVEEASEGAAIEAGVVYIAPPDRHLLVEPDHTIHLTQTELVHFVRPSADLLFESVAATFKEMAIAVVLTGTGTDASMGVGAIKKMGGRVIAQDEGSSEFFGMPGAAIASGAVDLVLPLEEIGPVVAALVMDRDD